MGENLDINLNLIKMFSIISSCRSCGSSKLKTVINLSNLSQFSKKKKQIKKIPLILIFCSKCKLLQLNSTVDLKHYFQSTYGLREHQIKSNNIENILQKSNEL